MRTWELLRLFFGTLLTSGLAQQQPPLAGGYSPSKVDDPIILEAAEFALDSLLVAHTKTSTRHNYSFAPAKTSQPRVIQASQQVVAGLNFLVTIMVTQEEDCVGAFTVTIYNHFGDLSVTNWGGEYTCEQAWGMLEADNDSEGYET